MKRHTCSLPALIIGQSRVKSRKPNEITLEPLEHGHLHLEHLLGLLGRLELEGDELARDQVHPLVDLPKAAAADLAHLLIKKSNRPIVKPSAN